MKKRERERGREGEEEKEMVYVVFVFGKQVCPRKGIRSVGPLTTLSQEGL